MCLCVAAGTCVCPRHIKTQHIHVMKPQPDTVTFTTSSASKEIPVCQLSIGQHRIKLNLVTLSCSAPSAYLLLPWWNRVSWLHWWRLHLFSLHVTQSEHSQSWRNLFVKPALWISTDVNWMIHIYVRKQSSHVSLSQYLLSLVFTLSLFLSLHGRKTYFHDRGAAEISQGR